MFRKVQRFLEKKFGGYINSFSEQEQLAALPNTLCNPDALGVFDTTWLSETFNEITINSQWEEDNSKLKELGLPEMAGGVNPGDQRALYYLARRIQPKHTLEIGTHIGCSTIVLALAIIRNSPKGFLRTVDIRDVNDETTRPWKTANSPNSPYKLLNSHGLEKLVEFKVDTSIGLLEADDHQKYDMIFLDGDHSSTAVYQEIPLALKKLNKGGIIILHDVFPNGAPLWEGQKPVLGPWLATARFESEKAPFKVLPLGKLPWPTKLGSNVTSLAILSKC